MTWFLLGLGLVLVIEGLALALAPSRIEGALRQLAAAHATVLRDGQVQVVAASILVPGDIVMLASGDKVPSETLE